MSQFLKTLAQLPVETRIYTLQSLPAHLANSQSIDRLCQILTTFDFLQAKTELFGSAALIEDYNLGGNEALQLIQNALRLSAHVLARNPSHLAGQLLGRLQSEEGDRIKILLDQARMYRGEPWLRPLNASLETAQGHLVYTFDGHTAPVRAIRFVPGSARLVSASSDHTLKVWDLANGQELFSMEGHTDAVYALAVSLDGKFAVSGSNDMTVQLWSLETGRNLGILGKHQTYVKGVAISPGGKKVVSVSSDRSIVWDVENHKILSERAGYTGYHAPAVFLSDDRRIVMPSEKNALLLWDPETGEERIWVQLNGPSSKILSIARSSDDRWVASSTDEGKISIWDAGRECEVERFGEGQTLVNQVVFMPEEKHVLAALDDNQLILWEWENQQNLGSFRESMEGLKAVAVDEEVKLIATGSSDRTVRVWDMAKLVQAITDPTKTRVPVSEIWTSDTNVVTRNAIGNLTIWNITNGDKIDSIACCKLIGGFKRGDFLLLLSETDGLLIYDTLQHAVRDKLPGKPPVVVTEEGCVISARDGGGLQILDLTSGQKNVILEEPDSIVDYLAIDKASRFVLAIMREAKKSMATRVVIWDLSSLRTLGIMRFHSEWLKKFHFSVEGRYAIFGGIDGRLLVWENPIHVAEKPWYRRLLSGRKWLTGHKRSITGILLALDGDTLITAADDRSLKARSLSGGKGLLMISNLKESQAAVTENGERVIVFSVMGASLSVWDVRQGKRMLGYTSNHLPRLVRMAGSKGKEEIQPTHFFVIDQNLHISKRAFTPEFSMVVWDLDKGEPFVSFEGDAIWTVTAVTTNGEKIIAGDQAGRVHIFELVI
jgi:WD40 repeat protein